MTVNPCTTCHLADICKNMEVMEKVNKSLNNLSIPIGDHSIMDVSNISFIKSIEINCKFHSDRGIPEWKILGRGLVKENMEDKDLQDVRYYPYK